MNLYNTLTKKEEKFIPINNKEVKTKEDISNIINSYNSQNLATNCTPYVNKNLTISERNDLESEFFYKYY